MKTKSKYLTGIIITLIGIVYLSTCDIELKNAEEAAAPLVNHTESGINLTVKKYADSTLYINVYRRDVTNVDKTKWNSTEYEKIGIIYPKNYEANSSTFSYEDIYVCKDKKYQYCVRYAFEDSKIRSAWSSPIMAKEKAGKSDEKEFQYDVSTLILDEAKQTIRFKSNVRLQDTLKEFSPMIVVKSDSSWEIFPLPDTIKDNLSLRNDDMPLVSMLSSDFLYTEINPVEFEILGILGQKKNYDRELNRDPNKDSDDDEDEDDESKLKVLSVSWTPISKVTVENSAGETVTKMKITSPTGQNGFDYSDLE